jgi:hypothetical protein
METQNSKDRNRTRENNIFQVDFADLFQNWAIFITNDQWIKNAFKNQPNPVIRV